MATAALPASGARNSSEREGQIRRQLFLTPRDLVNKAREIGGGEGEDERPSRAPQTKRRCWQARHNPGSQGRRPNLPEIQVMGAPFDGDGNHGGAQVLPHLNGNIGKSKNFFGGRWRWNRR